MKRYPENQSGAALILILFVVVFISITGTVLLNTTTYGLKSIVQNEKEEEVFYLLEGALDLALYKIREYDGGTELLLDKTNKPVLTKDGTPIVIKKKGPYFFVDDFLEGKVHLDNIFIDKKEIEFHLSSTESGATSYDVELVASLVNDSTISRKINLTAFIPQNPGGKHYIQVAGNPTIHHKQQKNFDGYYISGINFKDKIREYGLSIPESISENLIPVTEIKESRSYYNEINGSNKTTIIIPKDKIVYANSLNWNGGKRTLIVEGILIINKFHIQGSNTLQIKSSGTIIANNFTFWSNSPAVNFPNENSDDKQNQSIIYWNSNYHVNDYETLR